MPDDLVQLPAEAPGTHEHLAGPASLLPPTVDRQAAYQAFLMTRQRAEQGVGGVGWDGRALFSTMGNFWPAAPLGALDQQPFHQGNTRPVGEAAAEGRAFALLETIIGPDAAAKLAAGGGYEVPSRRMSGRLKRRSYLVPREGRVKILEDGLPVGESCILSDASTPWPDQVLHRIKAIQTDETVVFATGNVTMFLPRCR